MTLFDVMTSLVAAIVVMRSISLTNNMNGKTRHGVRAAVSLMAIAAFGLMLAPFYSYVPQWLYTLFVLAVAIYLITDRRAWHQRQQQTTSH